MSDKELLERAAKAAGMWGEAFEIEDDSDEPVFDAAKGFRLAYGRGWWNPLTDDGDALRLAVKLGLLIDARYTDPMARKYNEVVYWRTPTRGERMPFSEDLEAMAATRRAITRAAAEIGKALP